MVSSFCYYICIFLYVSDVLFSRMILELVNNIKESFRRFVKRVYSGTLYLQPKHKEVAKGGRLGDCLMDIDDQKVLIISLV